MQTFVGKRCLIRLNEEDPEAYVIGVLLKLTDDGEVHVTDDDGVTRYCWPCLEIAQAPRRPRVYFDFRDWWVGYFRGDHFHYVCILPTVVIRWGRHG